MKARKEVAAEGLYSLSELAKEAPPFEEVPTGVPGLDSLFFRLVFEKDKWQKIPLPGFPRFALIHPTGVSDTGKSLTAGQFALTQAKRGEKVLFVTVELPGPFLVQSVRERGFLIFPGRKPRRTFSLSMQRSTLSCGRMFLLFLPLLNGLCNGKKCSTWISIP